MYIYSVLVILQLAYIYASNRIGHFSRKHKSWVKKKIMPACWKNSFNFIKTSVTLYIEGILINLWWIIRHDKGSQKGNGVAGSSLAAELGDEHALEHISCRGLYITHFSKETTSHYEYKHCYQHFQLPHLPNSVVKIDVPCVHLCADAPDSTFIVK